MNILLNRQLKFLKKTLNLLHSIKYQTIIDSLCDLVGAGHGDERLRVLIGPPRCDGQRSLASVHLHPEVTVEPPAGI